MSFCPTCARAVELHKCYRCSRTACKNRCEVSHGPVTECRGFVISSLLNSTAPENRYSKCCRICGIPLIKMGKRNYIGQTRLNL